MANRIAEIPELSIEQLTILEPEDIEFKKVPEKVFDDMASDESLRFHIACPECDFGKDVPKDFLGKSVRCPKCKYDFTTDWGALVAKQSEESAAED